MEQTYKIGEAATLLNLKTYVLRFWETEFPQIAPLRTEKGQRLYRAKDIELLERIRYLLHEQGLTIDGARKILDSHEAEAFIPTSPVAAAMPSPMDPLKNSPNQPATSPSPDHSAPSPSALSLSDTKTHSSDSSGSLGLSGTSGTGDEKVTDETMQGVSQKTLLGTSQDTRQNALQGGISGHLSSDSPESDSGFSQDTLTQTGQGQSNQTANQSPESHTGSQASEPSAPLRPSGVALQTLITDLEEVAAILRRDTTQGSFIQ